MVLSKCAKQSSLDKPKLRRPDSPSDRSFIVNSVRHIKMLKEGDQRIRIEDAAALV